jgi:hypothetical protein
MKTSLIARLRPLFSLAVVAIVALLGVHALSSVRLSAVFDVLRRVRAWPLCLAALGPAAMALCRASLWRLALRHRPPISLRRLYPYTVMGTAGSVLLPFRGGEAVRVWMLSKLEGVSRMDSIGTALAERALDFVSMMIVLAPLPLLLPKGPRWITDALLCIFIAAIVIVLVVIALGRRGRREDGLFGRLGAAFSPLLARKRLLAAIALMTVAWLLDVTMLVLTARALGLALPPAAPLLVLLSVNLAVAVPAAPAQIGTHEAGTMIALSLLGVHGASAVAFALVYHATQVVPILSVAVLQVPFLQRALRHQRARRAIAAIS